MALGAGVPADEARYPTRSWEGWVLVLHGLMLCCIVKTSLKKVLSRTVNLKPLCATFKPGRKPQPCRGARGKGHGKVFRTPVSPCLAGHPAQPACGSGTAGHSSSNTSAGAGAAQLHRAVTGLCPGLTRSLLAPKCFCRLLSCNNTNNREVQRVAI